MGKKYLLLSVLILILAAGAVENVHAFASWVEFCNPHISYLDNNLYRFQVNVNWGGDVYVDPETGTSVEPILDRLWINNTLGYAVNWTGNHSGAYGYSYAGDWYGGIESPSLMGEFGLHGPEFGWDFIPDAPVQSSYMLDYTAFTAWLDYDYNFMKQIEGGSEILSGSLEVMVIPEPATVILLGIGFIGFGAIVRRR